jgi:hypothetical protein
MHCPIALAIRKRVFREYKLSWVTPANYVTLLGTRFSFFGGTKQGLVLGRYAIMAVFWIMWTERTKRIFENSGGDDLDMLWGRVCIWDSLWASISSAFRNSSFFAIYLDWPAAVDY